MIFFLLLIFITLMWCVSSPNKAWVQVACPRLSIDWGLGFDKVSLCLLFIYSAVTNYYSLAATNVIHSLSARVNTLRVRSLPQWVPMARSLSNGLL